MADLPSDLQSVLKKMSNSSGPSFARDEICAFELVHLAGSCGLPQRFVQPVTQKFTPKAPQFEYAAATLLAELAASLDGKVLGSEYSTDRDSARRAAGGARIMYGLNRTDSGLKSLASL